MGGGSMKSNAARKRVEADSAASSSLIRAKDGSAFARCEECNKDVPVALISMHSCSLDAKIKMNLEAQVVEMPPDAKKKPLERKKATSSEPTAKKAKKDATSSEPKAKKAKKDKAGGNSNKPKRPPTAYFIFMEDFRKEFREANPDSKDVKRVAKESGEKWRSMTDEEKKPYVDKAAELKAEYKKALESNNAENEDNDAGSGNEGAEKDVQEISDQE